MLELSRSASARKILTPMICLSLILGVGPIGAIPVYAADSATALKIPKLPIKNAERFRADAAKYDSAVAAIAALARARLDSDQEIEAAIKTVESNRKYLRLASSKAVVIALGDKTFTDAVMKRLDNESNAKKFADELIKDMRSIMKLNGAPALQTRIVKAMQSDGAKLDAAAKSMTEAVKKKGGTIGGKIVETAAVVMVVVPLALTAAALIFPAGAILASVALTPLMAAAVVVFLGAMAVGALDGLIDLVKAFDENISGVPVSDAVADCQDRASAAYDACKEDAADDLLPTIARLACGAVLVASSALCLID